MASEEFRITLPEKEAKWLRQIADVCNLTPDEVVTLQILAQQHVEQLTLEDDTSEEETEGQGRETVFDALKEAHERLDELNASRSRNASTTDRMQALRMRLNDLKERQESRGHSPAKKNTTETMIQKVLDQMDALREKRDDATEADDGDTSLFDVVNDEEG